MIRNVNGVSNRHLTTTRIYANNPGHHPRTELRGVRGPHIHLPITVD